MAYGILNVSTGKLLKLTNFEVFRDTVSGKLMNNGLLDFICDEISDENFAKLLDNFEICVDNIWLQVDYAIPLTDLKLVKVNVAALG